MQLCLSFLRRKFWPLSAIVLGPWHAFVLLSLLSRLAAGTVMGEYLSGHYSSIRAALVVLSSLYFVLALMMWAVGREEPTQAAAQRSADAAMGLSAGQIILFGLLGMLLVPALILVSALPQHAYVLEALQETVKRMDTAMNAGFIWLICISTIIMIPTMVIWLVWMWRAWNTVDHTHGDVTWEYEYE